MQPLSNITVREYEAMQRANVWLDSVTKQMKSGSVVHLPSGDAIFDAPYQNRLKRKPDE